MPDHRAADGGGTSAGRGRPSPSRAVEDYLKAIWKLQEERRPVPTNALAAELGRSAASVTGMIKALAGRGLVHHAPYRGVELSKAGERTALRIIRRHRVIETYLIERLAYTWDGVHAEAERLEHAASEDLVERMARALGDPRTDPHGAPIPGPDGSMDRPEHRRLSELDDGAAGVIREVEDESPERLRILGSSGFLLGERVRVEGRERGGDLRVEVGGRRRRLAPALAEAVLVEADAPGRPGSASEERK
ncbi:MAG: metal-dependent transcriptional regulator [Gemmatimonadota bacterium]|nr:metal-dependent transcriptional regulator [Gemmatimonadota bacterium]